MKSRTSRIVVALAMFASVGAAEAVPTARAQSEPESVEVEPIEPPADAAPLAATPYSAGTVDLATESVIGPDGRGQVVAPAIGEFPARAIGQIDYTAHDGTPFHICSGWFIDRSSILTAGHCAYSPNPSGNGIIQSGTFAPGRIDGANLNPNGICNITHAWAPVEWKVNGEKSHDYAVMNLDCTIGETVGWFGMFSVPEENGLAGLPATIQGYPGDKPYGTQWTMTGSVDHSTELDVWYGMDTAGGQSGSPVFTASHPACDGGPCGMAIHGYGVGADPDGLNNSGPRLTAERIGAVSAVAAENDPPGPPQAVMATAGNGEATVSWSAPTLGDVTGYTATAAPGGATCSTTAPTVSCTIVGLTNGVDYTVSVTAENAIGTGHASNASNVVTPRTVSAAPSGVAGVAGVNEVVVSWSAPASDGGAEVTGYTATASPGGASCVTATLSCAVTGLTNGSGYTFTVVATNVAGDGPASSPSSVVTPRTVPAAPSGVAGVAGVNEVVVSWSAPASDGGAEVTGYTATASPGGASCVTATLSCAVTGLTNGSGYTFTVVATNVAGDGAASSPSGSVVPVPELLPVSPARVLETRVGAGLVTVDGLFEGEGVVGAGEVHEFVVTGRGGVAADAAAVFLNVVAVAPGGVGYLTVFPCGSAPPNAANVNYTAGSVSANAVLAKVGVDGKVCVFTLASTHLVVDVNGYVPSGAGLLPVSPARVLETRVGAGLVTVDGLFEGEGVVGAGEVHEFVVTGRGGVAADAAAVFLNVVAVAPGGVGYLTVFPCGSAPPNAANVNYTAGSVSANAVLAKVGVDGKVCVFTLASTHLVVDVNGYVPAGAGLLPVSPARVLETRVGAGLVTVDGLFEGEGVVGAGEVHEFVVTGRGGVAADAAAVFLNVVAVAPGGVGYLTVFPCGSAPPNAANVNYTAGSVSANAVLAKVGVDGKVCVFTLASTHLVVDVNGYVPA